MTTTKENKPVEQENALVQKPKVSVIKLKARTILLQTKWGKRIFKHSKEK